MGDFQGDERHRGWVANQLIEWGQQRHNQGNKEWKRTSMEARLVQIPRLVLQAQGKEEQCRIRLAHITSFGNNEASWLSTIGWTKWWLGRKEVFVLDHEPF